MKGIYRFCKRSRYSNLTWSRLLLEHYHFFASLCLRNIIFTKWQNKFMLLLFASLYSSDVISCNNVAKDTQLDQKRITSLFSKVEVLVQRQFAQFNGVNFHLQQIVDVVLGQVRYLDCVLGPTLSQLFLFGPKQRQISKLVTPQHN